MRVESESFIVHTKGKGLYEVTEKIERFVQQSGMKNGTATVFAQHTSCSLIIMENASASAQRDLEEYFDRLVPEGEPYFEHTGEGDDDMPSHIRMVLTRTSETIPIAGGKPQLGTWQGVFLFEHRRAAHRRNIVLTLVGA